MDLEYACEQAKAHAYAGDLDSYMEANAQFHRMIVDGSHNRVLTCTVLNVRERLTPFRRYHPAEAQRIKHSEDAHRTTLATIQHGNAEKAYQTMLAHSVPLGSAALRALRDAQMHGQRDNSGTRDVRELPRAPRNNAPSRG